MPAQRWRLIRHCDAQVTCTLRDDADTLFESSAGGSDEQGEGRQVIRAATASGTERRVLHAMRAMASEAPWSARPRQACPQRHGPCAQHAQRRIGGDIQPAGGVLLPEQPHKVQAPGAARCGKGERIAGRGDTDEPPSVMRCDKDTWELELTGASARDLRPFATPFRLRHVARALPGLRRWLCQPGPWSSARLRPPRAPTRYSRRSHAAAARPRSLTARRDCSRRARGMWVPSRLSAMTARPRTRVTRQ